MYSRHQLWLSPHTSPLTPTPFSHPFHTQNHAHSTTKNTPYQWCPTTPNTSPSLPTYRPTYKRLQNQNWPSGCVAAYIQSVGGVNPKTSLYLLTWLWKTWLVHTPPHSLHWPHHRQHADTICMYVQCCVEGDGIIVTGDSTHTCNIKLLSHTHPS